ncbi:MAG TPA: hypothetical protein VNN18_12980 [Candidatus Xenobia bacterium]|nr:hypothetical protein [Candidatus Xenobia bacterium]
MNTKKFLWAALAVFVVYSALAYATHEVMLEREYRALGSSVRTLDEFTGRMPLLYLGNLIFALAVSYIYIQGCERGKNWVGQGLRFGLLLGTLLVPVVLAVYVAFPIPFTLALKWIALGYVQLVITAWVVAGIYRLE